MIEALRKLDRKFLILVCCLILIPLLLIIFLVLAQSCSTRKIDYGKYESKDILSWLEYTKANFDFEYVVLYGISMGGTSLAIACPQLDKNYIKAIQYNIFGELFGYESDPEIFFQAKRHVGPDIQDYLKNYYYV